MNAKEIYIIARAQGPRDDTRQEMITTHDGWWILRYAQRVDGCPRKDTRDAVLKHGTVYDILNYGIYVDREFRKDICEAILRSKNKWALDRYRRMVGVN